MGSSASEAPYWNVSSESEWWAKQIQAGRMTLAQVSVDMPMTDQQLAFLTKEEPANAGVLARQQQLRKKTLEAIKELLKRG